MLHRKHFILFPADGPDPATGSWQVGVVGAGRVEFHGLEARADGSDRQAMAQALAKAMGQKGYSGEGIVLALPSRSCFCASVAAGDLPRGSREQALLYRLEEKLPLAAEELVADFISDGQHALGVCTPLEGIKPLVDALEANGILVQSVCPMAMLALQGILDKEQNQAAMAALGCNGHVDVLTLANGKPCAWQWVRHNPQELLAAIRLQELGGQTVHPLLHSGLNPESVQSLEQSYPGELQSDDRPIHESAARAAAQVLEGRLQPWINLRRGPLAAADPYRLFRTPLKAAVAAAIVLLVCLNAGWLWRAQQYRQLAQAQLAEARTVFSSVLPDQKAPAVLTGMRTRLESEARKLSALSGASLDVPQQSSALLILRDILSALPKDLRYRVLDLRISGPSVSVDGQARSHAEAEAIAQALRQGAKLNIDPPKTTLVGDNTVSFALSGTTATAQEVAQR